MQVRYQTDLYAGHLLVPIDHNIDCNKYSYKMLERNRIKGVLSCKKRTEDGKDCLCFDITGKNRYRLQAVYLQNKGIWKKDLENI